MAAFYLNGNGDWENWKHPRVCGKLNEHVLRIESPRVALSLSRFVFTDGATGLLTSLSIHVLMSSPLCLCGIFPLNLQRRGGWTKAIWICHICCVAGFQDLSPSLIHPSFQRALPVFLPIPLVTTSFTQPCDWWCLWLFYCICDWYAWKTGAQTFCSRSVVKVQLSHANRPTNIIILQPRKKRKWSFDTMKICN